MEAVNLWYIEGGSYGQKVYRLQGNPVLKYRGVNVFMQTKNFYNFEFHGAVIAQRCEFGTEAIDDILDGKKPVSEKVAAHITAHGGSGYSYDQYSADYKNGLNN